jgi:hypothetical protein
MRFSLPSGVILTARSGTLVDTDSYTSMVLG